MDDFLKMWFAACDQCCERMYQVTDLFYHIHTFRHISAVRQGFRVWWLKQEGSEYAVYLTHDLSMLRLIETFCESAPQLTLMVYVMVCTNKARTVQREFSLFLSYVHNIITHFRWRI